MTEEPATEISEGETQANAEEEPVVADTEVNPDQTDAIPAEDATETGTVEPEAGEEPRTDV